MYEFGSGAVPVSLQGHLFSVDGFKNLSLKIESYFTMNDIEACSFSKDIVFKKIAHEFITAERSKCERFMRLR